MKSAYQVVVRPLITEKAVAGQAQGKYTFVVAMDSNKIEIASAIEEIFNVKVDSVNTVTVKGKSKRVGRHPKGMTSDWKKAIVSLKPGYKIEVIEGV